MRVIRNIWGTYTAISLEDVIRIDIKCYQPADRTGSPFLMEQWNDADGWLPLLVVSYQSTPTPCHLDKGCVLVPEPEPGGA